MSALLFRKARLIDPAAGSDTIGDLLVDGGVIAATGSDLPAPGGVRVIEAAGLVLAPGITDMRVHAREPGEEHKETLAEVCATATRGGVTRIALLPTTDPVIEDTSLVEFLHRRAEIAAKAKVSVYAALTRNRDGKQLSEIGLLTAAGAVGVTDGPRRSTDALVTRRALAYARTFGQMVLTHPEDPSLTAQAVATEGDLASRMGLPAGPALAEQMRVERDLHLAELTGGRLHIGPVSTAGAIEAIRQAKRRGVKVTCDTAPPYFALNETAITDYRTFAKLSPPLRGEMDRKAVVEGLADGTIDAITSDHAAEDPDSKRLPFVQAAFGAVGLETLLPLSLSLVHNGHMSLVALFSRLSTSPAALLKRPGGSLAAGAPADLLLADIGKPWRIDPKKLASTCKNSPFDGVPVQGQVRMTLVDGRIVFERSGA
jgi:dihydroorotase